MLLVPAPARGKGLGHVRRYGLACGVLPCCVWRGKGRAKTRVADCFLAANNLTVSGLPWCSGYSSAIRAKAIHACCFPVYPFKALQAAGRICRT